MTASPAWNLRLAWLTLTGRDPRKAPARRLAAYRALPVEVRREHEAYAASLMASPLAAS